MDSTKSPKRQPTWSPKPRPTAPKKPDRLRVFTEPILKMHSAEQNLDKNDEIANNTSFWDAAITSTTSPLENEDQATIAAPLAILNEPEPPVFHDDYDLAKTGAELSSEGADTASSTISGDETSTDQLPVPQKAQVNQPSSPGWSRAKKDFKARSVVNKFQTKQKDVICKDCENLGLRESQFVIDHTHHGTKNKPDFWGKKRMGTFEDIRAKEHCPLCRLLVQAMWDLSETGDKSTTKDDNSAKCYLYWTVDGRERVQERQSNRIRTLKRTRRLCIEWSNSPPKKAYVVLAAPEGKFAPKGRINNDKWERPTLFLGRLLTSIEETNIGLIRKWLNVCIEHHQDECRIHKDLQERFEKELWRSSFFTVIDVNDMCLTSLPPDEDSDVRYVALSYTWGEETRISGGHNPPKSKVHDLFKATTANVRQLEEKGGLHHALKNMPMAIQNAIFLTHELGYRYLWVDSLCITQDDATSWELNAEVMDVVYGNAEFTICAADGENADVGLKALFPPDEGKYTSARARHAVQHVEEYKGTDSVPLKLLLSHPSESYIVKSKWSDRAWTFQERLLSRRCVIFVAGRMYFQCRSTTMSEDIYSEASVAGWSVELQGAPAHTLKPLSVDPVSVYKKCLGMYTSRKLSHESDILAAFAGIANIVRSALATNCETCFGLPISHFDWALLWEPEELPERRTVKGRQFPSWSWCGWKGKRISYKATTVSGPEINLHEWLLRHTWITWYIRDGLGNLRLIWDPLRHEANDEIEDRWKGYSSPQTGLPAGSKYKEEMGDPKYDYHGRPFNPDVQRRGRVPSIGRQFTRNFGKFRRYVNVLKPGPEVEDIRRTHKQRDDHPFLQFWTWSAKFFLGEETPDDRFSRGHIGTGLKRFAILDRAGDFAGTCVLSSTWTSAAQKDEQQEFIAISDARDFDESEYGCWNLYNEAEREEVPWQLFNVMMLSYDGEYPEVAYRAGLGKVYQNAFDNGTDYDWKEIILG